MIMRKGWIALVVFGLLIVLPSTAGAATLGQRVAKLEAKLSCLQRTPMSSYLGYAWYETDGSVHALTDTTNFLDSFTAADFQQGLGDSSPPHYWVVAVKNTANCRSKFPVTANPFARPAVDRTLYQRRLARVR
jgi:hypothetical protein